MPLVGVAVGLALGLAAGGRPANLLTLRLRWLPAILAATVARYALEAFVVNGSQPADWQRISILAGAYALLAGALLKNRSLPGMTAAAIGVAANGIAILLNAGHMPIWEPSLEAARIARDTVHSSFYVLLPSQLNLSFLMHAGLLGDLIPVPLAAVRSVVSIGDLLIAAGLGFLLFAGMVARDTTTMAAASHTVGERSTRQLPAIQFDHPYAKLATNGSFSALLLGQLISLLGDRINQIALVFLVLSKTDNPAVVLGLVFGLTTVANLVIGPIAGALVDRWNHKHVMVASDLVRAAAVMLVPLAAATSVTLILPLVLMIAAVSTFFRPARSAALPRLVTEGELMAANSALWAVENLADIVGYAIAGLLVAFLSGALPLAFWLDAASYIASASLISAIALPSFLRDQQDERPLRGQIREGWAFLRGEASLFATTVQAMIAEYAIGALTVLSPLVIAALPLAGVSKEAGYGYFETAIGGGAVAGGVLLGTLGSRVAKGRTITVGFVLVGLATITIGLADRLLFELLAGAVAGLANMAFAVPSQTLFQQRTPAAMLGRVISLRFALVNAVLAVSMMTSGVLAQAFGIESVLFACGLVTVVAGAGGLALKAIRDV